MLGKLLKHDIKDILKSMTPIYLVLIIMSILVRGFGWITQQIEVFQYITIITTVIFAIAVIISFVFCFLLSIKSFYQKILKDEGYLTNTLPVKKVSINTSKILASIITMIITVIVIIIACMIAFYTKGAFENIWNDIEMQSIQLGYNSYLYIGAMIGILIFSYTATISMVNCALAIGHGFNSNKLAYSAIAGVIIYFIYEIINVIGIVILIIINPNLIENLEANIPTKQILEQIMMIAIINGTIALITSYSITNHQLKNRLNLE